MYEPGSNSANAWIYRFNSLGIVAPVIQQIWEAWWTLGHPGKAVCAVMYASGLVYLKGSPLFEWTWRTENLSFLRRTLSVDYLTQQLDRAARTLSDCPEAILARQVANDAKTRKDVIEIRIDDLLENLARLELDKDRRE